MYEPNHNPKQALDWTPQGKRKHDRLKQFWRRSVVAEERPIGLTRSEVKWTHSAPSREYRKITQVKSYCIRPDARSSKDLSPVFDSWTEYYCIYFYYET
ncbi:unnamed protein product [Pieris macdunnoughi]|uniref:Uncharacterized protein n=1 Tax=Pieris macdunnoughi TaxID=345717 RepID=A0A821LSR8_9NEOP|nr:unnamed protein product [Pieris macdunnoughi]